MVLVVGGGAGRQRRQLRDSKRKGERPPFLPLSPLHSFLLALPSSGPRSLARGGEKPAAMEPPAGGVALAPSTLSPAVPTYVTLGLTVVYTALYSLLFVGVYSQLWLVLRYGHKRLSYQTVFLFLCLLWAALRTVLFSFYFQDCVRANTLGPLPFWLLYCCPVCLQFFTLCLMNLYFAQVSGAPERSLGCV